MEPSDTRPLYQQIADRLREELRSGRFYEHERFYSEREISAKFFTSRNTASKALSILIDEGLLTHQQGLGAYVSGTMMTHDLNRLFSFTKKAEQCGKQARTQVLAYQLMDAVEPYAALGRELLYIERLRFVDDVPIIYEKRWVAQRFSRKLTREQCEGSIFEAMVALGATIDAMDQRVRAVTPGKLERELLGLKPGTACLLTEGEGYDDTGALLWMERILFRGDQYEFCGRITRGNDFYGRLQSEPKNRREVP